MSGLRYRRSALPKEQLVALVHQLRPARPTIQPAEPPRNAGFYAVPASGTNTHTYTATAEVESGLRPWRRRVKVCYVLLLIGGLFILGSMVWGIHCSLHGAMGDGFTGASWLVAVGTLVLAPPMAIHYKNCRCWVRRYHELPQQEQQQQPGDAAQQSSGMELMPFRPNIYSMPGRRSPSIGSIDYSVRSSDCDYYDSEPEQSLGAMRERWIDKASSWQCTHTI